METQRKIFNPKQRRDGLPNRFSNSAGNLNLNQISYKFTNYSEEPMDLSISNENLTYYHRRGGNRQRFTTTNLDNKHKYMRVYEESAHGSSENVSHFKKENMQLGNCPEISSQQSQHICVSGKRKRGKFVYTTEGKLVMVAEEDTRCPQNLNEATQVEILKAAKTLFTKRTRTLYQWIYPTASKQEIRSTVLTLWDSLDESEKAFYISQVLGCNQGSLMINPQLESIKIISPAIHKIETVPKLREPQCNLSTHTNFPTLPPANGASALTFEEFEAMTERTKRRRRRTRVGHVHKPKLEDFRDDPELSQELEKFAGQFNFNNYLS
ncbi:uncharacterized protein LOC114325092 isoform X2 [Diabrotica virgifera virgifera]|uniref:Uncharacterized protein LOC114325092 isoform X2 n=1 Tax=Diabrotica virgifera virgifera TaxID=50390 RepID=A0A6P7EZU9_DIAVI|nr:uncharacterized protein LOC114325092 isoform X2 [Diabrotica virgifera virgifera]